MTGRTMWRFLRREGGDYVFSVWAPPPPWWVVRRVPVERFWGGAR